MGLIVAEQACRPEVITPSSPSSQASIRAKRASKPCRYSGSRRLGRRASTAMTGARVALAEGLLREHQLEQAAGAHERAR